MEDILLKLIFLRRLWVIPELLILILRQKPETLRRSLRKLRMPLLKRAVPGASGMKLGALLTISSSFGSKGIDILAPPCFCAAVRRALAGKYQEFFCYNDLEEIRRAGSVERNLVLSPAGLAAAEFLRDKFGTPFVLAFPTLPRGLVSRLEKTAGKVLVVHQQFAANALREHLTGREAVCASFFRMSDAYMRPGDRRLIGEEDFVELVRTGGFAVIAADPAFRRLVPEFAGEFVDFPHFAVSGTLTEEA